MDVPSITAQLLVLGAVGSVEALQDYVYDTLWTLRQSAELMKTAAEVTAKKVGNVEGIIVLLLVFPPRYREVTIPILRERITRDYPNLLTSPLMTLPANTP